MSKVRNSNIELLRIISMLFIVMGHFVGQSKFNNYSYTINSYVIAILSQGSRIATNIFLFIGIWNMVDKKFDSKRILKIYGQYWFTAVIFTTIMLVLMYFFEINLNAGQILRGYIPFLGRAMWFASAYLSLYLLAPFLNKYFEISQQHQILLVILTLILISFTATTAGSYEFYLTDLMYFFFVYIWIGFFKKSMYDYLKINNSLSSIAIVGGGTAVHKFSDIKLFRKAT